MTEIHVARDRMPLGQWTSDMDASYHNFTSRVVRVDGEKACLRFSVTSTYESLTLTAQRSIRYQGCKIWIELPIEIKNRHQINYRFFLNYVKSGNYIFLKNYQPNQLQ